MIKFGTSGYRGIMGDNFTKTTVQKVAVALSQIFKDKRDFFVPVGYDNRFMGKFYAQWVAEALAGLGFSVKFYNVSVPSTLIAYDTKNLPFGIMMTASHNPYYYNGIKLFLTGGREPDSAFTDSLEKIANSVDLSKYNFLSFNEYVENKTIVETHNIFDYCNYIVDFIGKNTFSGSNISVLANVMHGSTIQTLHYIFKELGLNNYKIINDNIDPYFENQLPAPYKSNLTGQVETVVKEKFDFGFALDGDGDRISFIDSSGEIFDCNYIVVLIYHYLITTKGYKGDLVVNTAFSSLAKKVANSFGYDAIEAYVGFKNVANKMLNSTAFLGAESNGISFREHILHKDGIFIAILLIDILSKMKKSMSELIEDYKKTTNFSSHVVEYAYEITDMQKSQINKKVFVDKIVPQFSKKLEAVKYLDGVKFVFESDYWAMIRFSGNESVVRLFAEAENAENCTHLIGELEQFIGVYLRQ